MALTKIGGGVLRQPIDVGIITATSLNASGIVTAGTVQVGAATTIHTTGIDLGSGNVTSHNINSTGIITATSFVGPVTGNVTGNVTGDITATSGTFSGNVSIAGTLTYEDVTNVDSVGIVTAQSGIKVTGGNVAIGTITASEKLDVWGTIRASQGPSEYMHLYPVAGAGYFDVSNSTTYPAIIFRQKGSGGTQERLSITSDGKIVTKGGSAVGALTLAGDGEDITFGRTQNSGTGGVGRLVATGNIVYLQAGANASSGSAADLVFCAYGGVGEKLRITSAGDMGLGTVSPRSITNFGSFAINGTAGSFTDYFLNGTRTGTTAVDSNGFTSEAVGSSTPFRVITNGSERLRITSAGNIGIGDNSPSQKLNVAGNIMLEGADQFMYLSNVGTGNAGIYVRGNTSGSFLRSHTTGMFTWEVTGSEKMRITSAGDLFVAGTGGMNTTQLPNGSTININGNSSNDGFSVIRYSSGYGAYGLNIGRSKSDTVGTNAAVTNGNDLGHITFYGADGTDFNQAAAITAQVDGTPSDGADMPGRLIFKTSSDGTATPTERLRIDSDGHLQIRREGIGNFSGTDSRHTRYIIKQTNGQEAIAGSVFAQGKSNWGGDLVFATKQATANPSTGLTERMRLNAAGYLTTPYQPAWSVFSGNNCQSDAESDLWLNDIWIGGQNEGTIHVNTGSHYTPGNGRFTAPVSGKYWVYFAATTVSTSNHFIQIVKNGSPVGDALQLSYNVSYMSASYIAIFNLAENDYVTVKRRGSGYRFYNMQWGGYLIG